MKLAIVSVEDKRFTEHNGVDWQGTLTGVSGHLVGNVNTPLIHHRTAVREELPVVGDQSKPKNHWPPSS